MTTTPLWKDSRSRKILDSWLSRISLDHPHSIVLANVSDDPTEGNRPLKMREVRLKLNELSLKIQDIKPDKIIALGKTAARALTLLHLDFYEMPHPSPINRVLNNKEKVQEYIDGLKTYIQNNNHEIV